MTASERKRQSVQKIYGAARAALRVAITEIRSVDVTMLRCFAGASNPWPESGQLEGTRLLPSGFFSSATASGYGIVCFVRSFRCTHWQCFAGAFCRERARSEYKVVPLV